MPTDPVLKELAKLIDDTTAVFDGIAPDDIPTALRAFKEVKEFKEELDALQEQLAKFYTKLSYEYIPNMLEREGVDSVKLAGRNFIVATRLNASIPSDKKEEGFRWLEDHGMGALIQPAVNPKSLSSAMGAYLEEKGELPPPEAMSCYQQKYMSVRKA